ncbi:MAG: antibiotic biosynthesis monooxygenase [Nocardiopsaceae bacterium]|nr:antibiotic biosynthesis monooxygenase [Nocardiopsaceae bacterium]
MNIIPLTGHHGVFIINIFTVPPENQQALAEAIRADGHDVAIGGLLSRHLLCSADGTQVAHCMHWASEDDFKQAVTANAVIGQIRQRVHELGAHPNSYETVL